MTSAAQRQKCIPFTCVRALKKRHKKCGELMGVCFGVHCSRRAFVYACVCNCSILSDFSARAFLVVSRISWRTQILAARRAAWQFFYQRALHSKCSAIIAVHSDSLLLSPSLCLVNQMRVCVWVRLTPLLLKFSRLRSVEITQWAERTRSRIKAF